MRVALAISILVAISAPLFAGVEVTQTAGRISIRADQATVSEVLERVSERTAMRVVYDGAPPAVVLTRTVSDRTLVDAVVGLLEGLALKYAMVLDDSGTRVRVLLISTAPAPPRAAMAEPVAEPVLAAEDPAVVVRPPDPPQPLAAAIEPPAPAVPAAPATQAAAPSYASYAGPFTPQGPGPVILPHPGAVVAPAAAAAPAGEGASAPAVERTLLGTPSAALPPWMKAGYYGGGSN